MRVVVVRRDRGRVAAAVAAVGLEREVADAARAVAGCPRRRARPSRPSPPPPGRRARRRRPRRPRAFFVRCLRQHGVDLGAMAYGAQHLVAVDPGAVALGLGDRVHLGAQGRERLEHRLLEVGRPRVVAAPRVGYVDQRPADVLDARRVDAVRHLAEPVVVVPHVQVAHRHAAAAQLVGDEVGHQELAQVAQVHGPGGGDARRAGHRPVGAGALVVADGVVRGAGHPVGGVLRGHGSGSWVGLLGGSAEARTLPEPAARAPSRGPGSGRGERAPATRPERPFRVAVHPIPRGGWRPRRTSCRVRSVPRGRGCRWH